MTDRIREIRERLAQATSGPWLAQTNGSVSNRPHIHWINGAGFESVCDLYSRDRNIARELRLHPFSNAEANAAFIAASPTDIAYLLSELDRRDEEIARLRDVIDRACNALTDSIKVSGNDASTNIHWVRKLRAELEYKP